MGDLGNILTSGGSEETVIDVRDQDLRRRKRDHDPRSVSRSLCGTVQLKVNSAIKLSFQKEKKVKKVLSIDYFSITA